MPRAVRSSPIARVRDRASEPVEFGDDEGVAFAQGGECLVQAGACAVGTGKSMVEVDPILTDAEFAKPLPLRGEVLGIGGASAVSFAVSAFLTRCRVVR